MIEALEVTNFEDLYAIHNKEFNIGFMDVSSFSPPGIEEYLNEQFHTIPTMFKCIVSKDDFEETLKQIDELYYILDESDKKTELINFVKTLISYYADITDAPEMGVSLEKVKDDMCKYFHCDMNHLRLVYSLIGPGTLWTKEDNLRREFLGKGMNEAVIIDQEKIYQVPNKTVTLLKGQAHPTAHGKAVVHASPKISSTQKKRILLRIESLF